MDIEELFLRTCDDLQSRIISPDEYVLLGASKLIRQMFLDGSKSFVDIVNRTYRLRLRFQIVDTAQLAEIFAGLPSLEFFGIQDALDPAAIPNPPVKVVSRDEFFSTILQLSGDTSFTVKDIVLHQANAMGGIHAGAYAGPPRDNSEAILSSAEDSLTVGGLPPGLRQLRAIGTVVLRALQPIRMLLACNRAIETNPEDAAAYYNRGTVYAMCDKLRQAIGDLDKAIELDPSHPNIADAYCNRAHVFLKLARLDLEEWARLTPDSPERAQVLQLIEALRSEPYQDVEAA